MVNNIPVNGWPQLKDLEAVQPILNRLDKIEAWKRTVKEETFTGEVITIDNALALPARSLKTTINAIQDLHGLPFPYVGGAYKNKLIMTVSAIKAANTDGTWSGNAYTLNNTTFTILTDSADNVTGFKINTGSGGASDNAVFRISTNVTLPSGDYKFNGCIDGSNSTYFIQLRKAPNIDLRCYTTDRDFTYSEAFTYAGIVVLSGVSLTNKTVYPMIRLSTESDASFAPYSNLCPISGRTAVVLTRSDGDGISEDFTIQLGTTVYGADINWDTGVATVLDAIADMGDLTWTYNGTSQVFNSSALPGATTENVYTDAISSSYKEHQTGMSAMVNGDFRVLDGVMTVKDTAYTDATAFKTAVTGQTVCYKLATPTTIQLTPAQLELLKGVNHITLTDGYGTIELKALTGANWS